MGKTIIVLCLLLLCCGIALSAAEPEDPQIAQATAATFDKAAREHAAGFSLQDPVAGIDGSTLGKLATPVWPLRGIHAPHKVLNRAPALMALAKQARQLKQEGHAAQVAAYCRAAGAYLASPQAGYRALACEFLAYFPVEAIENGALPAVGELLADDANAFPGIENYRDPSPNDEGRATVSTTTLTVAEVARAAIFNMVYLQFDTPAHFHVWWQANTEYARRLWYWSMRFEATDDDWAQLGKLPLEQSVKILLLLNNETVRQQEITAAWQQAPAGLFGGIWHNPVPPTVDKAAQFLTRHKGQSLLLDLLAGTVTWPEVQGDGEVLLGETIARLLPSVLTKADAAAVQKIADEKHGLAASPTEQVDLILDAALLDPEHGAPLLLAQLERTPDRWDMALGLLQISGLQHWETLQRYFAKFPVEGQCMLIRQLGALNTPQARDALGGLFTADRLEAAIEPGGKIKAVDAPRAARLHAYFDAVQALNDNTPVIDPIALETATRYGTRKDADNHEESYASRDLFPARSLVIRRLKEFFAEK